MAKMITKPALLEQETALIVAANQLAGHFPTDEDIALGQKVYLGEITGDEAVAQIIAAIPQQ